MPADEQIIAQEHNQPTAAPQQSAKQARSRQSDDGPEILPCMEHFVTLVRKAKRPGLALLLVERASATSLPEVAALTDVAKGILAVQSRKAMFHAVAKLGSDVQQHIERAAERVVLLDDEYGTQAVQSLLDDQDASDAAVLSTPSDRYSRALHLCLRQDFPEVGAKRDQRFDNAERLQVMHRQWKSENYSSHYLGPKGVVPSIDADVEGVLRGRISALFPQVASDQILIEQFTRRDLAHADRCGGKDTDEVTPVLLHTLTATFNGSTAHFRQVANGEVVEHEEPAAMSASFSWEPDTGALGVFCEDREVRRELATTGAPESEQFFQGNRLKLPHFSESRELSAERAKIVKQMWSADGKNAPEVSWAEVNRIANTGYQSFDDAFGGKAEREDVIALVKRGKYRLRRNP
jgi:hypothetical protein